MTVVLGTVLAAIAVLLVALPFLREPAAVDDRLDRPDEQEEQRLHLVEQRDQALAALKELEFDHRTAKIGDQDYRELVGPLRQEVARTLRALEADRRYGPEMSAFETPDLPPEPAPPPDEGTLPTPPPDEGTLPTPPPDEGTIPQE